LFTKAKVCLTKKDVSKIKKATAVDRPIVGNSQIDNASKSSKLASSIGGDTLPGRSVPFDIRVGTSSRPKHFVDVKIVKKASKAGIDGVYMPKDSLARKLAEAKKHPGVNLHTVVIDDRTGKMYYDKGIKTFKFKDMQEINESVLKKIFGKPTKPILKPKPPRFTPAKTVDEAKERFSSSQFGSNFTAGFEHEFSKKELLDKVLNPMLKEFDRIEASFLKTKDIIRGSSSRLKSIKIYKRDVLPGTNQIGSYLAGDAEMFMSSTLKKGHDLHRLKVGKKNFSVSSDLLGIYRHEFGHFIKTEIAGSGVLKKKNFTKKWNKIFSKRGSKFFEKGVSRYAGTNADEAFSECFSAYTSPKYKRGMLPKDIESLFDDMFG